LHHLIASLFQNKIEIIRSHPHVNLYQIHDALSFYYENRDELDQKMKQDREFITRLKKNKVPVLYFLLYVTSALRTFRY